MKQAFLHATLAVSVLAWAAPAPAPAQATAGEPRKPNIVLIVADDLGYGETGAQGYTKDIPTPNIDAIAKNGVRFTQGYVSAPLCSPTRAGLMTGRYQQRFGHEFNPGPQAKAEADFGLPRSETTLAERMKALGYATGMVGKWHLGNRPELTPPQRGFDSFFGFLGGAHPYLPVGGGAGIFRGAQAVAEKEYLTDAFAREAVAFVDQHQGEPFFLYLPFNAVHAPLQASEKYLGRFADTKDTKRRTFAAMLTAMDDAIGRVLGRLVDLKLSEQTLVLFVSDNGGPTPATSSGNGPLRGYKGQVYEGGIRVPFMMQWAGRLPAGRLYDFPVTGLDIHATAIAASGAAISPDWKLDGVNLLPYLRGENAGRPHDTLFWRMGEKHAIRDGDWKMLVEQSAPVPALFNLAADIGEKSNLAAAQPEKLKELVARYDAWSSQMSEPMWERGARNTKAAARKKQGVSGDKLDARFKQLDRDGDGKLSASEFPRPNAFRQMDRNRDGSVTLEEARAYWVTRQ